MNNSTRTAGLTSQDAVHAVGGNRYELVLVAAQRMRELARGSNRLIKSKYGDGVTALLEIEQGHVGRDYLFKEKQAEPRQRSNPR